VEVAVRSVMLAGRLRSVGLMTAAWHPAVGLVYKTGANFTF
jgi:hypothetical protein